MMLSSATTRLRLCRLTHTSTRSLHRSASLLYIDQEPVFEGVSPDISKLIYDHAHQPQTSVSLQALMRTGRGEFLHKTYKDEAAHKDEKVATERVLRQVCIYEISASVPTASTHTSLLGCWILAKRIAHSIGSSHSRLGESSAHERDAFCEGCQGTLYTVLSNVDGV